jgi:glycosyltransferase involved in cell wall biosynthesis
MNILYLCDEYPPGQHGGIGTAVRLLARQMVKMGHKVIVAGLYTPGYGGEDEFEDDGVKVYRYRWLTDSKWVETKDFLPGKITKRVLNATGITQRILEKSIQQFAEKLELLIAEHNIDMVEMPDYNDYVRFCTSYLPFPKLSVPIIVKMHGSITYTRQVTRQPASYIVKMEQHILNQSTAVVGVSQYMAAQSAKYLYYNKPVEVLYNGIDANIVSGEFDKNHKQVIFTGTLVQSKGIYQLAKAWNVVIKSVPDAQLLVSGRGDQQKANSFLTDVAKPTVKFTGHVSAEELFKHLSQSAIGVFPSYSEAFALAPMEAMACGVAVINTNRASGPELIDDGIDGVLIDPDNVEQIASAIIRLLSNPDICRSIAKKGNGKVKTNFDIAEIATKHICFYNKVLGR